MVLTLICCIWLPGLVHLDRFPEVSSPPPVKGGSAVNFMYMKISWPDVTEQELDVEQL